MSITSDPRRKPVARSPWLNFRDFHPKNIRLKIHAISGVEKSEISSNNESGDPEKSR
jgi:hypothetical protein